MKFENLDFDFDVFKEEFAFAIVSSHNGEHVLIHMGFCDSCKGIAEKIFKKYYKRSGIFNLVELNETGVKVIY